MRLNEFSNDKKNLDEVSLGDYRNKALKQQAQSQMNIMFARSPEEREKNSATFYKRERGLNRLKARDDAARKAQQEKQLAADIAALPELKAEYESMKAEYKKLGGSNWQYADREQNLTDYERKARAMEGPMNNLWRKIQAAEKARPVAEAVSQGNYNVGLEDIGKPVLVGGEQGYVLLHIGYDNGSGKLVAKVLQPDTGANGYYDLKNISRVQQGVAEGSLEEDKGMTGYNAFKREWRAKHGAGAKVPAYDSKEYTSYVYRQNDKKQGVAEGTDPNTQSHADAFKSETDTMKPGTTKYVGRKGGKEVTAKKDEQGNVKFYHRDGIKGPLKRVTEGYTVTRGIDRERYTERDGLEGPFSTKSGKVVYYDKVEGKYYDPETDFYIEYDDWRAMNEAGGDVISFELSNERAYNHVMQKFGNFIDWQDEAMTIPRKYWDSVQELALSAGGEAVEYGTLDESATDTVYPDAEVIKSKNGKPVGEIYQDEYGWGCLHYQADRGYDMIDSRKDAIQALKDIHSETARRRPDYTVKGVAEAMRNTDDPFDDMVEDYLDYLESIGMLNNSREEEKAELIKDLESGVTHSSEIEYALSGTKWDPYKQGVSEVSDTLRNRYVARASDDYGMSNFAARASKGHPGLEDYSKEQEARAKKRAAGLGRALSDKRTGRISETTGVTDYNPKSQGGTRAELLAKFAKSKSSEDATAARKAGATETELRAARDAEPVKESRGRSALRQAMESVDANQKKAKQVPGSEMPKKTSPVIGKEEKQHPFKGRAVGGSI